jgi:hypothetical protein
MSEHTRINPDDYNLDEAPKFRKVASMPVANTVRAEGGEKVTTKHTIEGQEVTEVEENIAAAGDMIVERSPGDKYIIEADKFEANYEIDPENPDQYRSKNHGRAVMVEHDFTIEAPWGGDQNIKAGGIIWRNEDTGETYGNQKYSFEGDFAREGADGSLMPLTEPLETQRAWAQEQGGLEHLKDIEQRIQFEEASTPATPATSAAGQKFDM